MKMWINNIPRLAACVSIGLLTSGAVNAGENLELDEERRAELEASLDEARAQLDKAAAHLGELHGQLYKMETLGSHGKKPMLGVLLGDRSESGGLEVVGVTPGGGAEEAGIETGDDLISVNNVDLTTAGSAMQALREAMQEVVPGDSVAVGYQRDGSVEVANVTTTARGFTSWV
jgi:S1-C subfamily serine protease